MRLKTNIKKDYSKATKNFNPLTPDRTVMDFRGILSYANSKGIDVSEVSSKELQMFVKPRKSF